MDLEAHKKALGETQASLTDMRSEVESQKSNPLWPYVAFAMGIVLGLKIK